jgi:hypothetical protein
VLSGSAVLPQAHGADIYLRGQRAFISPRVAATGW